MKAKKKERAWEPYYCDSRKSWVIPLTQGLEALIDESDVPIVGDFKWFANPVRTSVKNPTKRYVYPCSYGATQDRQYAYLHRFLMQPPEGFVVDHLDGNTLDNRRSNLRVCSRRENNCNLERHRSGKMLGASRTRHGKFTARITVDGKNFYIGTFDTEHESHQAYLDAYNDLMVKEKSAA